MANEPGFRTRLIMRASSVRSPAGRVSAKATDESRRLGFQKSRKLSRVFADFPFIDSLVGRKSVEEPRTRPSTGRKISFGSQLEQLPTRQSLEFSVKENPSRSMSPPSTPSLAIVDSTSTPLSTAISDATSPVEANLEPPIQYSTPPTPQDRNFPPPEQSPPLPSLVESSHHFYNRRPAKKRRKSLDLIQLRIFGSGVPRPSRSQSLRVPSLSDLSRPNSSRPPTPSTSSYLDVGDTRTSDSTYSRSVAVKRTRKMTQLFGQELPPDLIQALGDQRVVNDLRHEINYTTSNTDSRPETPLVLDTDSRPETPIMFNTNLRPETPLVFNTDSRPETPLALDTEAEENIVLITPPTENVTDFQERRKRMAKLTQFFGVNHAEIAPSITFAKADDQRPTSMDDRVSKPASLTESAEVGVKVISRRWGRKENMKNVEMSDAITKLRGLKAS